MRKALIVILIILFIQPITRAQIVIGAEQMDRYLPLLKGRSVAIFANATSVVGNGNTHLVDTLLKKGIHIVKLFSPEHGFRGDADAGAKVGNQVDSKTGIPIISLYGAKTKPTAEDLADVDIMLYDIQDVGVRFYTYIGSLQRYMEAAIENHRPLVILDRPDPNGSYVDGPVLDTAYRSFVGMQPVPIVYGMTIGEYARMLIGEHWVHADPGFKLTIIPCRNYTHRSKYILPVKPSPNLPTMQSVYLYGSLCLFEGTDVSLGRGTTKPFQQFGNPDFPKDLYSFTPESMPGATNPPQLGKTCYGYDLSAVSIPATGLSFQWVLRAYSLSPNKDSFFLRNGRGFDRLAGGPVLRQQIRDGLSEADIRKSWEPALQQFKAIRKKYLLYAD
ncbi:MAG TPA: DUF1343 domain-containing protein [Puia sp.]|nr:DUF1343 domain-containing protein [Puia sp.]